MPEMHIPAEADGSDDLEQRTRRSGRAFGKDARLTSHKALQTVKQLGEKTVGRFSILIKVETPPDACCRAAFLISRRFDHLAVVRNRARRLYREVFRVLYLELPPMWMLFIPKRSIKAAKMQDVLEDTRRMLGLTGKGIASVDSSDGPVRKDVQ